MLPCIYEALNRQFGLKTIAWRPARLYLRALSWFFQALWLFVRPGIAAVAAADA